MHCRPPRPAVCRGCHPGYWGCSLVTRHSQWLTGMAMPWRTILGHRPVNNKQGFFVFVFTLCPFDNVYSILVLQCHWERLHKDTITFSLSWWVKDNITYSLSQLTQRQHHLLSEPVSTKISLSLWATEHKANIIYCLSQWAHRHQLFWEPVSTKAASLTLWASESKIPLKSIIVRRFSSSVALPWLPKPLLP